MSLLQMSNICKSFGGISVLKNVQLTVEKGEVHALLGENGAGKSTLMNVLTGVFPRDKGEIEFDGNELKNITIKRVSPIPSARRVPRPPSAMWWLCPRPAPRTSSVRLPACASSMVCLPVLSRR